MNIENIITIIERTGGTLSTLISQIAFFFAINSAAHWLSFTLPCLLLFTILLRIAKSQKALAGGDASAEAKTGGIVFAAWLFLAATLFTGVRGLAHVAQAAVSPAVYVASELGGLGTLIEKLNKQ